MPLSTEELAAARKTYKQVRSYNQSKWMYGRGGRIYEAWLSLLFAKIIVENFKDHHIHRAIFFLVTIISLLLLSLFRLYRLPSTKLKHAENVRFLEELTRRNGAELPIGPYSEPPEEHPLLEYWSRRLEQRAILWRLDAFLSRRPSV